MTPAAVDPSPTKLRPILGSSVPRRMAERGVALVTTLLLLALLAAISLAMVLAVSSDTLITGCGGLGGLVDTHCKVAPVMEKRPGHDFAAEPQFRLLLPL